MSLELLQIFKNLLTEHGHSVTAARIKTFELLVADKPQTMAEIIARDRGSIDRVTIYRNIDLFERLGIVNRMQIGWKYKLELSDLFHAHHHHLTCLGCGAMIDIHDDSSVEEFISKVAQQARFTPVQHQFEITGYCQKCS